MPFESRIRSEPVRRRILAALMLTVLALCTALAALLSASRGRGIDAAPLPPRLPAAQLPFDLGNGMILEGLPAGLRAYQMPAADTIVLAPAGDRPTFIMEMTGLSRAELARRVQAEPAAPSWVRSVFDAQRPPAARAWVLAAVCYHHYRQTGLWPARSDLGAFTADSAAGFVLPLSVAHPGTPRRALWAFGLDDGIGALMLIEAASDGWEPAQATALRLTDTLLLGYRQRQPPTAGGP